MAGFGLRALKKVQEDESLKDKRHYISHIVYGDSSFAILTYLKLLAEHGEQNVKLICESPIDQQSVLSEWKCSVSSLRNADVAQALMHKKPQLEILPVNSINMFYKDAKFHKFTGRAKPYELQEDESYFIDSSFQLKQSGLFTDEQWNSLDETLSVGQLNKYISHIEICKPDDMIEKSNFKIHTGEHENFECEFLYWCKSPKEFYKKVEDKESMSDDLGKYCSTLEHRTGLVIHFDVDKKIFENKATVFLPQSATHEWGHFICDFNEFNEATGRQEFSSLMFVDEDEVNEEDLAKKIRLMKRVIERIFTDFAKSRYDEVIHYSQELFINKCDDTLFNSLKSLPIKFVGQGAPIEAENSENINYIPRAIISYLDI
jgi:hypothetical protein